MTVNHTFSNLELSVFFLLTCICLSICTVDNGNGSKVMATACKNWSQWSACSASCDIGIRRRVNVTCDKDTQHQYDEDFGICNTHNCHESIEFASWRQWSACSVSCGFGSQERGRTNCDRNTQLCEDFRICINQDCHESSTTTATTTTTTTAGILSINPRNAQNDTNTNNGASLHSSNLLLILLTGWICFHWM